MVSPFSGCCKCEVIMMLRGEYSKVGLGGEGGRESKCVRFVSASANKHEL